MKLSPVSWKGALSAGISFYAIIAVPIVLVLALLHWADSYTEPGRSGGRGRRRRCAWQAMNCLRRCAKPRTTCRCWRSWPPRSLASGPRAGISPASLPASPATGASTTRSACSVSTAWNACGSIIAMERSGSFRRPICRTRHTVRISWKGIRLAPGDVYISRFDLNIERGQIEIPAVSDHSPGPGGLRQGRQEARASLSSTSMATRSSGSSSIGTRNPSSATGFSIRRGIGSTPRTPRCAGASNSATAGPWRRTMASRACSTRR